MYKSGYVVALLVAVLARWLVSLHKYSGAGNSPMYGDFEAQRHWMEITYHLPPQQWYFNSTNNNLLYWGLDYPPLTAYHSWLCGFVANKINPSWVALKESHGHESYAHKLFMRYTVILADVFIFFPAVVLFFAQQKLQLQDKGIPSLGLHMLLSGLELQANGAVPCLTILLLFVGVVPSEMVQVLCSHLSESLSIPSQLIKIAVTVISTFLVCWLPFLRSKEMVLQVLHRVFPLARGLYEDKVANVWCSLSVLIKLKQMFTVDQLVLICLLSTLVCLLPSSLHLLCFPTTRNFKISLVNSSLVFFLFSFHVHEKSILIPALAVSLLVHDYPFWCVWFYFISTFSMLPLFVKDDLVMAAVATTVLHALICKACLNISSTKDDQLWDRAKTTLLKLSMMGAVLLTVASLILTPPPRYPDLFPVLVSIYSCAHFVLFLAAFHYFQFQSPSQSANVKKVQ